MRILVIRFSSLGDVILASAPLRALASRFPEAEITFVTKERYAPLFATADPAIRLITLTDTDSLEAIANRLGGDTYDWIVDLHGSLRSRILSARLKSRHVSRVKKATIRRWFMVWGKRGLDRPLSVLGSYMQAAAAMGELPPMSPYLALSTPEQARVSQMRGGGAPTIGIGWGARHPTKAVPEELWAKLFELLGTPARFVLFAEGAQEIAANNFIAHETRDGCVIEAAVDLPFRELMVRLAACSAFVSSDSGLMHLAAALDVPTLGLFGPTHPALGFAPAGEKSHAFHAGTWCSPCHRHGSAPCFRERRFCFDELDVNAVAQTTARYIR
jgi:heptosyltransferase-2